MTSPSEDLTATEGVDEGSAASTVETEGSGAPPAPEGPGGPVDPASEPAQPLDLAAVLSGQDAQGSAGQGSGQQLEAGEG